MFQKRKTLIYITILSVVTFISSVNSSQAALQEICLNSSCIQSWGQIQGSLQLGSANLMNNSGRFNNVAGWTSSGSTFSVDSSVKYGGYNTMKIVGQYGISNNTVMRLKANTTYTISALVKGSSNLSGGADSHLHIQSWRDEDTSNVHQEASVKYDQDITTNWKIVYQTFTTPASANATYARMYFYPLAVGYTLNVAYVKLEQGDKYSDWTVPIDEVIKYDGGNVGIGTTYSSDYKLNVSSGEYGIYSSGSTYGIHGYSDNNYGVYGDGYSSGLYGYSNSNYGVTGDGYYGGNFYGSDSGASFYGNSYGVNAGSGDTGVYGSGSNIGVLGTGNYGVYGSGSTYDFYGSNISARNYFAGKVGIGVDNNPAKLAVAGDIDLPNTNSWRYIKNSATNGGLRLGTGNSGGSYTDGIEITSGGGYIKMHHNVGIGVGSASPSYKLDVVGSSGFTTIDKIGPGSNNPERGAWNPIWSSIASGRAQYVDEEFAVGANGVTVYNNSGGTGVQHFWENGDGSQPNSSGKWIRIVNNGSVTSPGLGGFYQTINCSRNKTFVQRFRAKLPTGYNLVLTENAQGSNNTSYWLTSTAGTGKWEEYIRVSHCGNTGTFSNGGHVYVTGSPAIFTWYLASSNVYEADGVPGIFSGSVGIGTVAPGYKLDVQGGQINASGGFCIAGSCKTNWSQITGNNYWTLSGSSLYASSTSYNVGIGTTNSGYKLEVVGDNTGDAVNVYNQDYSAINSWSEYATGVYAGSNDGYGLYAQSNNSNAIYAYSNSDSIYSYSPYGGAIVAESSSGYGIFSNAPKNYFSGSVGIGTSNPAVNFHTYGNIAGLVRARLENASASGRAIFEVKSNSAFFDMRAHGSSYSETLLGQSMTNSAAIMGQNGKLVIGTPQSNPLVFGTNGATRMTIDIYGNINNTNEIYSQGGIHTYAYGGSDGGAYLGNNGSYSGNEIGLYEEYNGGGLAVMDYYDNKMYYGSGYLQADLNTGNIVMPWSSLGIGSYSAAARLNVVENPGKVHGASQGTFILDHENTGGASSIVFRSKINRGSDYGYIQYQDAATVGGGGESARLILGTSNDTDDHLILSPTGNVGIGTLNPGAYKVDVVGQVNASAGLCIGGNCRSSWSTGQNLLDTSAWTISSSSIGQFNINGTAAENQRVWFTDPFGRPAMVWKSTSDGDDGPSGGWNTSAITINPNKSYRSMVWIMKPTTGSGSVYLGCDQGNTLNLDNSSNNNPYFFSFGSGDMVAGRWYLLVGYIHANNDSSTSHYSAMYDGVTGQKVKSGTDYKNSTGATQVQRTYNYYDTTNGSIQYFWGSRFEEINGTEPSIEAILGNDKGSTNNNYTYFGGSVGIGTTSSTYKLGVEGTVGAQSFTYTSDRSLKKNIATIESPLTKILKLRGVTFDWKKDGSHSVGLIAQEVEKVFPELVSESNGLKSVQYGNLVAPLIEAVKEQQKEINNLKNRIELLENKK